MKPEQAIRTHFSPTAWWQIEAGPPIPTPTPVCTHWEKCVGCPYPAHGFLCWGQDGQCLRTIMEQKNQREERLK